MSVRCIICKEELVPEENNVATKCGHLFHQLCLAPWIQRSGTCPQCRAALAHSGLFRIYINAEEEDEGAADGEDDASLLQCIIDASDAQLKQLEAEVSELQLLVGEQEAEAAALRLQLAAQREEAEALRDERDRLQRRMHAIREMVL